MKVRILIFCILAYVITNTFAADVVNAIAPAIFNAVHPSNAVLFNAQIRAVVYGVTFGVVLYLMSKVYDAFKKPRDWRNRSDNEQSTKTFGAGMTKPILVFVGALVVGFALGRLPIDTDWYSCVLNHTKVGTETEGYVVRAYCEQGDQWWQPKLATPTPDVIPVRPPILPGPATTFIPDPTPDFIPVPVQRK